MTAEMTAESECGSAPAGRPGLQAREARLAPARLAGRLRAPTSKSCAHRLLMAAALADRPTAVRISDESEDIAATAAALEALGAELHRQNGVFAVMPIGRAAPAGGEAILDCGESGTTLRFLVPIAAALGRVSGVRFVGRGRLPMRPLSPLSETLQAHGVRLEMPEGQTLPLRLSGRLEPGRYQMAANISSQFVGGLLYALSILDGDSELQLQGPIESAAYTEMTLAVLRRFGAVIDVLARDERGAGRRYRIRGQGALKSPGTVEAEGDWSNAAFWLCAGAMGAAGPEGLAVTGLSNATAQGDRAVLEILGRFGAEIVEEAGIVQARPPVRGRLHGIEIDASQCPDLAPALAVAAAAAEGPTIFVHAERLRLKESDRIATTAAMLRGLGADVEERTDGLMVMGCGSGDAARPPFPGGRASSAGDHRIAMAAAVAALVAAGPVVLEGPGAVAKSYPRFWADYADLGGRAAFFS